MYVTIKEVPKEGFTAYDFSGFVGKTINIPDEDAAALIEAGCATEASGPAKKETAATKAKESR